MDYSIDFAERNPDWGTLSISHYPRFNIVGYDGYASHMVNYRLIDSDTLEIHDGLYNIDYNINDWRNSGDYYHFWLNHAPVRTYKFLYDNRNELDYVDVV